MIQPHAPRQAGYNVDPVDVDAGLAELLVVYPDAPWETRTVIIYALQRWARGEEAAAEKGATDRGFHGLDFQTWRRVLAAAVAAGTAELEGGSDVDTI